MVCPAPNGLACGHYSVNTQQPLYLPSGAFGAKIPLQTQTTYFKETNLALCGQKSPEDAMKAVQEILNREMKRQRGAYFGRRAASGRRARRRADRLRSE